MGRRGPPPKPTALKVIEGNRGKRPLRKDEWQPEKIKGAKAPEFLDLTAKREWNRIVPELAGLDLLTKVDLAQLAAYCQSFSTWVYAERRVRKTGRTAITTRGTVGLNPFIRIARDAKRDMLRFAAEFGFTPASRTRIQLQGAYGGSDETPEDPAEKYFD